MAQAIWLHCRLARSERLDVYVSVASPDAVFASDDAGAPDGIRVCLCADEDGRPALAPPATVLPPGALSLPAVALAMDPARATRWLDALGGLLRIENRVDAESALREIAVHLDRRMRTWLQVDSGFRRSREDALRRVDPGFAGLLVQWPAELVAGELGRFPELEPAPTRTLPEPDAEHWASWSAREVDEVLGENGGLARLLGDRFEFRSGQLDMGLAVGRALERDEHLMCEAGTGIGKSVAYLVPALLHGARNQQRVVVSTHTHTLQTQLMEQDLPLLQRLGYPGQVRRLLGRNNYLCRRQLIRALAVRSADAAAARPQFALAVWSQTSVEGKREELVDHPWYAPSWKAHFASIEPCSPHICHRDPVCFVVRARREAREAHLVVVNHALLMMDVRGEQALIGPAGVLVVDEAHQLPDVATHALSMRIAATSIRVHENLAGDRDRPGALRAVFGHFARTGSDEVVRAAQLANATLDAFLTAFQQWLLALTRHFEDRLGAHANRPGQHRIHDAGEAFGPVRGQSEELADYARGFATALATLLGLSGDTDSSEEPGAEREALANLLEYHDELSTQIRFVQEVDDEDHVYWVDWGGESGLRALVAAPLAVASPLARAWDEHYQSVVMTSATLAVESDFMPFAESVGFDQVQRFTETLQVESPFRADEQSLLLTAMDLPAPDDAHFPDLLANVIAAIARSVVTKMLVLSTSYRLIDQLEPRLREAMAGAELDLFDRGQAVTPEILAQRPTSSRESLVARFRNAPAAVLLATGSFWEGVDFPGDQLEVLVVPRLPFPVPTDPVVEGRAERARRLGRDPFEAVSLVDAVLRLKQGVGRLLRTSEDRGVVLLFDQRLQTRTYGIRFLNSLPRLVRILPEYADMVPETVEFLDRHIAGRKRKS